MINNSQFIINVLILFACCLLNRCIDPNRLILTPLVFSLLPQWASWLVWLVLRCRLCLLTILISSSCVKYCIIKNNQRSSLYKPEFIQAVLPYRRCRLSRLYSRPLPPSARARCWHWTGRTRTAPCPRRSLCGPRIHLCDSEVRGDNVWK